MSDTTQKSKYDFLANILKLSKTKLESELPEEWFYMGDETRRQKDRRCICNAKIKNVYHYINPKTCHAIMAGSKCKEKLNLKKINKGVGKKIINMFLGKSVTYEIIQNLENYSLFCLKRIFKLLEEEFKNLKQKDLHEYKKKINDFLEKADFKDTKKQKIVIEKFKSYLHQIENRLDEIKHEIKRREEEEKERARALCRRRREEREAVAAAKKKRRDDERRAKREADRKLHLSRIEKERQRQEEQEAAAVRAASAAAERKLGTARAWRAFMFLAVAKKRRDDERRAKREADCRR